MSRNDRPEIAGKILRAVRPETVIGGGHSGTADPKDHRFIAPEESKELPSGLADSLFVARTPDVDGSLSVLEAAREAVPSSLRLAP
ncbi:MAG: hypothetical protein WHT06_06615 [Desulfobacterales bacterium]